MTRKTKAAREELIPLGRLPFGVPVELHPTYDDYNPGLKKLLAVARPVALLLVTDTDQFVSVVESGGLVVVYTSCGGNLLALSAHLPHKADTGFRMRGGVAVTHGLICYTAIRTCFPPEITECRNHDAAWTRMIRTNAVRVLYQNRQAWFVQGMTHQKFMHMLEIDEILWAL